LRPAGDQAGFFEDGQVGRDVGLGAAELGGEVDDAPFPGLQGVPAELANREPADHLVRAQAIQRRIHHNATAGPVRHLNATGTLPSA
jgi:hypothetical protein